MRLRRFLHACVVGSLALGSLLCGTAWLASHWWSAWRSAEVRTVHRGTTTTSARSLAIALGRVEWEASDEAWSAGTPNPSLAARPPRVTRREGSGTGRITTRTPVVRKTSLERHWWPSYSAATRPVVPSPARPAPSIVWTRDAAVPRTERLASVPLAWPTLLLGVVPTVALARRLVARLRTRAGHCPTCGYDLRATPDRCPECGAAAAEVAASR